MVMAKVPPLSSAIGRNITNAIFSLSSPAYSQGIESFSHSGATVVPLGSVANCGWSFFFNSDVSNFVTIRNGSGGADFLQLKPQEFFFGPLLPACVPYILADTANCLVEWLILSR